MSYQLTFKPLKVLPYFQSNNTLYEKFVNKKWVENSNCFPTRQTFIDVTSSQRKSMSEDQKQTYPNTIPEESNTHSLKSYFKAFSKRFAPQIAPTTSHSRSSVVLKEVSEGEKEVLLI